jgi:hypothetical protein
VRLAFVQTVIIVADDSSEGKNQNIVVVPVMKVVPKAERAIRVSPDVRAGIEVNRGDFHEFVTESTIPVEIVRQLVPCWL